MFVTDHRTVQLSGCKGRGRRMVRGRGDSRENRTAGECCWVLAEGAR
jgi:hypothetical protein